jgi:hypothetical protein
LRTLPQPSFAVPQVAPTAAQVSGWQPQTFGILMPQVAREPQTPQSIMLPQPSGIEPQLAPFSGQFVGMQAGRRHWLSPPHSKGSGQSPQLTYLPATRTEPHWALTSAQGIEPSNALLLDFEHAATLISATKTMRVGRDDIERGLG